MSSCVVLVRVPSKRVELSCVVLCYGRCGEASCVEMRLGLFGRRGQVIYVVLSYFKAGKVDYFADIEER